METEYFNLYLQFGSCPKMPAWKNQKRHNKSPSPVIMVDPYIVGAADIMAMILLFNEGGLFLFFVFTTKPAAANPAWMHDHCRYSVNSGYYFEIQ